jgi:aromatic ring-opening dioxygenase catalytic subunit (LigB family)
MTLPVLYIPHGGGPCFFMDWDPPQEWNKMAAWLGSIPSLLGSVPKAILVVSAHWEEKHVAITAGLNPPLIYDYYGFPDHTYQLKYDAPGAPVLSQRILDRLTAAEIPAKLDAKRGFDHGVFIPFKLIYPQANLPVVQVSLQAGLDPAAHIAMGRALAPLREEEVLIVGSGMSYHNLRAFGPGAGPVSDRFDQWLTYWTTKPEEVRNEALLRWDEAPGSRLAHPREEHLLPLMVAAGAAGADLGVKLFEDRVMGATVSAFGFGMP